MTDFSALLQQGVANAWLFIPSAILLGALHGLEPGHSKTMMAAFIVAIRGRSNKPYYWGLLRPFRTRQLSG
jgi:nickel/cobalt exporter